MHHENFHEDFRIGTPFTPRQIDERRVELERIALFSGRPVRDMVISTDEILNLRITLETSKSVENFIQVV